MYCFVRQEDEKYIVLSDNSSIKKLMDTFSCQNKKFMNTLFVRQLLGQIADGCIVFFRQNAHGQNIDGHLIVRQFSDENIFLSEKM